MNTRYYGSSGMGAAKCPRITNLILQMDLKTWKQWNIWNAAAFIMPVDAGWFRRQYCQDRSIFSESARAREPAGVEGAKMDPVRNAADRRGSEHTAKHTFNATRSHLRVDARFLSHSDVSWEIRLTVQITRALILFDLEETKICFSRL